MKIMITILGFLIVLAGVVPFLGDSGLKIIPEGIPTSGTLYYGIIIVIGAIGIIYGFFNHMLLGVEKFVTIIVGLMTVFGGVMPFIASFLPETIPTSGPLHSGIIVVIGLIGIIYGMISVG